jgi:hypothetical protein
MQLCFWNFAIELRLSGCERSQEEERGLVVLSGGGTGANHLIPFGETDPPGPGFYLAMSSPSSADTRCGGNCVAHRATVVVGVN